MIINPLDCFTLDDGPPRKFDDPAQKVSIHYSKLQFLLLHLFECNLIWKEFLEAIRDGVYPEEIRPRHGQEIEVELIDKKGEEYAFTDPISWKSNDF